MKNSTTNKIKEEQYPIHQESFSPFLSEIEVKYKRHKEHSKYKIIRSTDIVKYMGQVYANLNIDLNESFIVMFINRANNVIGHYIISKGSASATVVDVGLIVALACKTRSNAVILIHNHPSGNIKPSNQDIEYTKRAKMALGYVDVALLDHIIMTAEACEDPAPTGSYWSFADEGSL